METIKLDLIPGKKMPSLHASQYDDGRDYHIDLTENRAPYTLDGTETISLTVRKCDNTLVTMDIANTFADKSYIEFRTTEQMNACAGFNYGEITIEKNGTQISSLNFYLQVEGAPDEGGIQSQSEINNLKRQVHDFVVEELEDNGASETGYDNTESGLEATNVQDAIDEVNTKIDNIPAVDAYTKEQSDEKFATKTALQTVENEVSGKASASEVTALSNENTDARLGANNVEYESVGNAIRKQVSNVSTDLLALENIGKVKFVGDFARGSYGYTAGNPVTKYTIPANQVISTAFFYADFDLQITIASGFESKFLIVDSNGNYISNSGWLSTSTVIRKGNYFYFGIKRATEITENADIDLFVSQITYTPKIVVDMNGKLVEDNVAELFDRVVRYNKNHYEESKAIKDTRYRWTDNGMISVKGFDVYAVKIPSGKMAVVSCNYNGGTSRQYVRSCRYMTILKEDGTYVAHSNSDTGSAVYTNSNAFNVIAYFTLYNSENATVTAENYMIQLFDAGTPTSQYITEYIPYGFEFLTSDGKPYLQNSDYIVNQTVQDYFVDEVADTVTKVLSLTDKPCLTFAFVTDTHNQPNDSKVERQTRDTFTNLKAVCERVPILRVYHGGDYVRSGWTHSTQFEVNEQINRIRSMALASNQKLFAVNGNHDGIDGAPPLATLYDCLSSHNEDFVVRENDNPFFYADEPKTKVRVIFLSNPYLGTYGIPTTQLNWFKSVLDSTPSGYDILIVSHIDTSCPDFTTNKTEFCNLINSWHNHTGDYTSNTGKVIAYIAGHRHFDWTVPTSKSGLDFPVVVSTCSFAGYITPSAEEVEAGAQIVNVRTDKTVNQDSWSVFVYRPDENKLHLIRFGAGNDRTIDLANWDTLL